MKKFVALLLILLMTLSVCACSTTPAAGTETATEQTPSDTQAETSAADAAAALVSESFIDPIEDWTICILFLQNVFAHGTPCPVCPIIVAPALWEYQFIFRRKTRGYIAFLSKLEFS